MPDKSTGVCAARTNALVCNIHELITELEERIEDGEPFDNPKLTRTAERVFGGSRAQGRYTPRDAYDAVEIAVNNHLLEKHAGELMQMDVTEALASVLRPLMQRLPRQTDRTLEQTELQQFSTPPTLAYLAARLLNPKPDDIVLEPSAGTGSLAIWPRAVGAKVICNERSLRRFALLRCVLNFEPFPLDAEFIDDLLPADIQPSAVLMNPPFSSTSGRVKSTNPIYGGRHVASALRRLKDGGRLVAIVSEAMSFHHPSFSEWWQRIACLCNIRANFTLGGKEYAKYGAAPDVQILVIDTGRPNSGLQVKHSLSSHQQKPQILDDPTSKSRRTVGRVVVAHSLKPLRSCLLVREDVIGSYMTPTTTTTERYGYMTFDDPERLLDVSEAAALLHVKGKTLYAWVSRNQIPYRKIRSLVRFHRGELIDWAKGQQNKQSTSRRKELSVVK